MGDVDLHLREFIVALERLESSWRREHSLTANEKHVISFLASEISLTPTRLSELVGLTSAGMSALIDRLEAEGYVVRRRHPSDGRRVLVTPTKKAMQARVGFDSVALAIAAGVQGEDAETIASFLESATRIVLGRAQS